MNTTATKVNYLYRCSRCGKLVSSCTYVEGEAKYYGKSGFTRRSKEAAEQRAENARGLADFYSKKELIEALQSAKLGDYRRLRITGKCPICSYEEPWQCCIMNEKDSERIVKLNFSAVLLMLMGIAMITAAKPLTIVIGVLCLGYFIAVMYYDIRINSKQSKMRSLCKNLPELSKPYFYFNNEGYEKGCQKLNKQPNEQVEHVNVKWYKLDRRNSNPV